MKLNSICSRVDNLNDKTVFIPTKEDYHLFCEYLNSIYPLYIESEKTILSTFFQFIQNKSQAEIEMILLKNYEGFIFINGAPFAKIAGANDLAPSILYDFEYKNLTIYHPNTKAILPENISFEELTFLLSDVISISKK